MINQIEGAALGQALPLGGGTAKPTSPTEDFSKFLGDMVGKVNSAQREADGAIQKLMTGEAKGLHEVMIAMEKSSVSFQFLTQVRNKAVEAYQEIMRMPV
ncbi:flagellar hook-basal body complex protein FliE [Geobacter sp. DSM 9736]|uniref:flagellar hook-basal body complex protein FliE n=1 Tax=Geobacter sp. DSM 9736 TaxID=1277350 RepID=UPI000B511078|nr:flagellar hook-basal body complex protein FliE [Geobacter sp. DSM 9736]SNB47063.1 flagellar hook-basal body complex protein FliE [Geobacter sp. DSM 9736]